MTALLLLGTRLVRAGGRLRVGAVVAGTALAVVLLTTVWELPDGLYPVDVPLGPTTQRFVLRALLLLLVLPVVALLLAVGRLSAELRDRRLAALRLLGLSRAGAAVVAAVENVVPASLGAGLGAGLYALASGVARLGGGSGSPLPVTSRLPVVAVAVVALSGLLAVSSLRRRTAPRTTVSEAAALRPSPWRLLPLALAAAGFVLVLRTPAARVSSGAAVVVLTSIVLAGACILLTTPLVTSWLAVPLVRAPGVSATIAGRTIETQGAGVARRVTAVGATVFLALTAAGLMSALSADVMQRAYAHEVEVGPQRIEVAVPGGGTVPDSLVAALRAVDGVAAVVPDVAVSVAGCEQGSGPRCPRVVVATCRDLAALADVTGCQDGVVTWLEQVDVPPRIARLWGEGPERPQPLALDLGAVGQVVEQPTVATARFDVASTTHRWLAPTAYDVVVPPSVAAVHGARAASVTVVAAADDTVRSAVARTADAFGASAASPAAADYQLLTTARADMWAVAGGAAAITLLTYAVATVDRARATRRARARLVAVGAPVAVLRRAQLVATLAPLLVALGLAAGTGALSIAAVAHLLGAAFALDATFPLSLVAAVLVGCAGVSLLTLPLTRRGVRPGDLRQE